MQQLFELEFKLNKLGRNSPGLRKDDQVRWVRTAVPVDDSQPTLEAVAQYGLAERPPDGHYEARWVTTAWADPEIRSLDPAPAFPIHSTYQHALTRPGACGLCDGVEQ